jgi:2-dehydro-3-deoxyphosphogluconate aldolase / (4S)-4-hydroxy-2-oxoglutarate aldolase
MTPQEIIHKINTIPIIPVYYNADEQTCLNILSACYRGGIRVFEFTNRGDNAVAIFKVLREYVDTHFSDMALGIGTIYTTTQAQQFIDLGADFIVQPCTVAAVGEVCNAHNKAWIPGVMTITEINNALLFGADMVKVFPGNVVGSAYIKALRGPMPNVKIMVTGGVEPTTESLNEWFGAGVNAVGIGSALFPKNADSEAIELKVKGLLEARNFL